MELTQNKTVSYLAKLIAVFIFLGILFLIISTLKPQIVSFLNGEEKDELIVNGTVSVNKDLPFYDEFVKGYKQCKLSPSTECFCQIPYSGTPTGYIINLASRGEKTAILVEGGVQVEYSSWLPGRAHTSILEGVNQTTARETEIDNDKIHFKNTVTLPEVESRKLGISDFTIISRALIQGQEIFSTKDVGGSDSFEFEGGVALYKFNTKDSTLFPISETDGLTRCNQVENLFVAEEEYNRLLSIVNDCIRTNQREKCKYVPAIPNNYTINVEEKKFVLKYGGIEIKSSEETTQNLCLFNNFRNIQLEESTELSSFNFNDYVEVDFYPFQNDFCLLGYDQNQAQEKRLAEERARVTLNQPII